MKGFLPLVGLMLALTGTTLAADRTDSIVVFNEIMYHPASTETLNEWIELHNQMSVDVDISGWRLSGGVDFIFPEGTRIKGGGYLIVASSPSTLNALTGLTNVLGPLSGRLDNGGEGLNLRNNSDRLMDRLDYRDSGRWTPGPDGSGASLAKADPDEASEIPENWVTSEQIGGTPGARNFRQSKTVRVTTLENILPIDWVWKYEQSGTDLGSAWREPGFDDSGWSSGPALLGVESATLPEPLQTPLTLGQTSYYFRTTFDYTNNPAEASLSISHIVDDGLVIYLNGAEVWRIGMPTGPVSFFDFSNRSIGDASYEGPFAISAAALQAGPNVLAVEVHQRASDSSDIVFGLVLDEATTVEQETPTEELPEGLNSYWNLDLGESSILDQTGGNHGTAGAGVQSAPGITGPGALSWDGTTNAFVNVGPGTGNNFSARDGITIETLLIPQWTGQRSATIFQKEELISSGGPLVSYWPFDEADIGTTDALDIVGNNNGIFIGSAQRTAGLFGLGAAQFNNSGNDGVNVGSGVNDSFSFTTGLTLFTRFQSQWTGNAGDYDEFFRKEDGGNRILLSFQNDPNNGGANPPVPPGPVLSFGLNVGGYGELDMPLDGANGRPTLAQLTDGTVHSVAATYDSLSGLKAIYIDGTLRHSVTLSGQILSGGGASAVIGNVSTGGGESFNGVIDEMAIWSSALTAGQILNLATGSSPLNITQGTTNQSTRILLALQNDGNHAAANPPVSAGPALAFGLNVDGDYSELDMPLDGLNGRPTLVQLQDGQPHHLVATYENRTGTKALYLDGQLAFSTVLGGNITSGGVAPAVLGNNAPFGDAPFQGTLDEITFWNRDISPAEIQSHFTAFTEGRNYFASTSEVIRTTLAFNELASVSNEVFWVEILNYGSAPVQVAGHSVLKQGGGDATYVFPANTLQPGDYLQVTESELGFRPQDGGRLFLINPAGNSVLDSVVARARDQARYPEVNGGWVVPTQLTPAGPNLVGFNQDIVINEIMYDHRGLPATEATFGPTNELLNITASWRYNQENIDLNTAWKEPGYDDATWDIGNALLYVTPQALPAPKNTLLSLTDSGGARKTTFYFRTTFNFSGNPSTATFILRHIIDDGAVFYLNGEEILKVNMPVGSVSFNTLATANVGIPGFSDPIQIPTDNLLVGDNVLAVEVHQVNPFSGDVVFGAELSASVELSPAAPYRDSPESWVELYNRGTNAVDMSGWRFDRGVEYNFPPGTMLAPDDYLVVAKDVPVMLGLFPGITVLGPFEKDLSGRNDDLILDDHLGNPVDAVHYYDGGRWPAEANGGGSSLELRDPRADNSSAEAWAPSDEGSKSQWQTITYRGIARSSVSPPSIYNEFILGLLDEGVALIDDVSVIENPSTTPVSLIQNGTFATGLNAWRIIGNHSGQVIDDPASPGNKVLLLQATGPTEHMHNHAETTVKNGSSFVSLVDGREYEISLRAKWISGSSLLNTRLWFNRLARTTDLSVPQLNGTPGAPNSRRETNIGPTYGTILHDPPVPLGGQEVNITTSIQDPDGVNSPMVFWSVNGGDWNSQAMTASAGAYTASLPGQSSASVVQFYVQATDMLGAVSTFPAAGPESRALYIVDDGQALLGLANNLRIIMTPGDTDLLFANTNLMSNGRLGATVIYNETEVFYDAGVRLKGSEHGRPDANRLGFNIQFPSQKLFRGIHRSVAVDRSGGWRFGTTFGQDEILIKHIMNAAGKHTSVYDDLIRVIAPRNRYTGSAILQLARFNDIFLDSQYPNGTDGTTFEYELVYALSQTTGGPEGLKLPQEGGVAGVPISNLGDDKEDYRHYFIIKNNRDADHYSKLIASAKAVGLPSGSQFHAETDRLLDVDQWLRAYAISCLAGPGDNYWANAQHNLQLHTLPGDGKTKYLVFDTDFAFIRSTSDPIDLNSELKKFLTLPANRRLYQGHLLDIMNTTYNPGYMSFWVDHYDDFLPGQNFSSILSYIQNRESFVRSQLPGQVPFAITTNGGEDFSVDTPTTALTGTAWINVKEVRLAGHPEPLPQIFTGTDTWQITVPLLLGTNHLVIEGVGFQGEVVASDQILVLTSSAEGGLDSDHDGMPDAWEIANGLLPDIADGSLDNDFDGMTNLEEYLAGTDPLDENSFLLIESVRQEGAEWRLRFRAAAGRAYSLQFRDALSAGAWSTLVNVPVETETRDVELTDNPGSASSRFYRLVTPAQP